MTIEPIGFLVFLLGLALVYYGFRFAITALCISTLLGAAAAFQLPALGGSSIQPSHLLLLFVTIVAVDQFSAWLRRRLVGAHAFLLQH